MITPQLIHHIAPNANPQIVAGLVTYLPDALVKFEINTHLRIAHFLGQCAEESAGFRTLVEYASGEEYEGRRDLGNVHTGDGVRFKGRGLLMITGAWNYKVYGEKLGIDLVDHPESAAEPHVAVLTACQFWHDHGLNAFADRDDVRSISHRINGGWNGLADRELYVARAKAALAD